MKLTDKFEKLPGVYILTNLINGKQYVGETKNIRNRFNNYRSQSGQAIEKAIRKYGLDNFKVYVEYLPDFTKKDLLDLEESLIKKLNCLTPNGYNICSRGQDSSGVVRSIETREKISKANKGRVYSEERKAQMSLAFSGENNPNYGKKHSEETKLKISKNCNGFKGKNHSKATKEKMKKIKEGESNPFFGRKHSAETLAKMAESQRLAHARNKAKRYP